MSESSAKCAGAGVYLAALVSISQTVPTVHKALRRRVALLSQFPDGESEAWRGPPRPVDPVLCV